MQSKYLILLLLILSACVQLPPTPEDIEAKRFAPIADKAVIYIVRSPVDSPTQAAISLSGVGMISTHPGTYYRWVVTPGMQRIEAFGASTAAVTLHTRPGQIYFVRHVSFGSFRSGSLGQHLEITDETTGRAMVLNATLL